MTIKKAVDLMRENYPSRFSDDRIVEWLRDADVDICVIDLKQSPALYEFFNYYPYWTDPDWTSDPDHKEIRLLLSEPFTAYYPLYLLFRAQEQDMETDKASNTAALANTYRSKHLAWYLNNRERARRSAMYSPYSDTRLPRNYAITNREIWNTEPVGEDPYHVDQYISEGRLL